MLGERGEQPAALLDERRDPLLHLGAELERDRARELRGHRQVVRQHDLLELLDHPLPGRPRSRAGAPRATTPSSTCARRRAGATRRRARARSSGRTRRTPRRRRAARRRRRPRQRALDRLAVLDGARSGCSGCTRTRRRARATRSAPAASSTSIEKSAARSPTTTSVPVIRAMCACSAYVGSNIAPAARARRR